MIASNALALMDSYITDVLSGEQVVCSAVRAAVMRHVRDLERESTKAFPYYFNKRHAEGAIEFFPAMLRHSIGSVAGHEFHLEPWQAFAIGSIHGWKRIEDDTRRFRRVYWSMGRKNGKSTVAAGLAIFAGLMDVNPKTGKPESVAEVLLSATKRDQSNVIYNEIERMRSQSKWIAKESEVKNQRIYFKPTQGTIRCVSSDKPFDGLNPHMVVMDELHAWKDTVHRKFYDTMLTGSGNREQPLLLIVTTAGDDKSYLWLDEYKYAMGVVRGEIEDESIFAYSFELDEDDDPLDEANWIKANPNLGVSLKIDWLREQALQAKQSDLSLSRFTRYHGNRIVSATNRAFDLDQWDKCHGQLSDWQTADAIAAAVDLGARDDLAAWALVARFPTDKTNEDESPVWRYEARTQCYIASDSSRDLTLPPFCNWVHRDLLKVSKYPLSQLMEDLLRECTELPVSDVAYDPYNGQQFAEALEQAGVVVASYSQTCSMFHEPIMDLRQAMQDGRLVHNGDPLLRWCIGNAVIVRDVQDRWMFGKRDSSEKIDAAVAMTMAYRRAMVAPPRSIGNLFIY